MNNVKIIEEQFTLLKSCFVYKNTLKNKMGEQPILL